MKFPDLSIKCRSYCASPEDRIEFAKAPDQDAVWLHAYAGDEKSIAVKVNFEDLKGIMEYFGRLAPAKLADKLETLREIHAALGKIVG